jgi:hypothetical protein
MKGKKMPGQRFYRQIAAEALSAVRAACDEWDAENGPDDTACEQILAVYPDGSWVVTLPDRLQDHNTCSSVPAERYTSRTALARALWDAEAL